MGPPPCGACSIGSWQYPRLQASSCTASLRSSHAFSCLSSYSDFYSKSYRTHRALKAPSGDAHSSATCSQLLNDKHEANAFLSYPIPIRWDMQQDERQAVTVRAAY